MNKISSFIAQEGQPWYYLSMDQHNNKNSIDEIDQRIIEALQQDGRRAFTK